MARSKLLRSQYYFLAASPILTGARLYDGNFRDKKSLYRDDLFYTEKPGKIVFDKKGAIADVLPAIAPFGLYGNIKNILSRL